MRQDKVLQLNKGGLERGGGLSLITYFAYALYPILGIGRLQEFSIHTPGTNLERRRMERFAILRATFVVAFYLFSRISLAKTADRTCELDLLLIGSTGYGKSSTGNTILSRNAFKATSSFTSVTKWIQFEYTDHNGRTIKVVDSPGVGDTDLSEEDGLVQIMDSMNQAIAVSPQGYHAFLLVFKFGQRYTKEDERTIKILKHIFGEEFVRQYCIIVVTHGDLYKPEEHENASFLDWISGQSGPIKTLVDEVRGRVILFNNKIVDLDKMKEQVDNLIRMVDKVSVLGLRYTDTNFKMAQLEREWMLVESKVPVINEETVMETSLILQQLGRIQLREPEKQMTLLETLKSRADTLLTKVKEQDKCTGVLQNIILSSREIVKLVDDQIIAAREAMQYKSIRENEEKLLADLRARRNKDLKTYNSQLNAQIQELERKEQERSASSELIVRGLKQNVEKVEKKANEWKSESFFSFGNNFIVKKFKELLDFLRNLV